MDWSRILDISLDDFYAKTNAKFLADFKRLTTNYQRVSFLIEYQQHAYLKQCDLFLGNLKRQKLEEKSLDTSNEHKLKGNTFYAKSDHKQAFKHYTLAQLHAPSKTAAIKPLVLALSNRSAVFNAEKLYDKCLSDIDTIKNLLKTYPPSSMDAQFMADGLALKLINREINCLVQMQRFDRLDELEQCLTAKNAENNVLILYLNEKALSDSKEQMQKLASTKRGPNQPFVPTTSTTLVQSTNISDCVDVKFSSLKGRYCVASKKIDAGECLFVEKAYCAILIPEFNDIYCQQCFKQLFDPKQEYFFYLNIDTCDECTSVFYCSTKCKLADARKHVHECGLVKCLMHNLGIAHLAYRILATTPMKTLLDYAVKMSPPTGNVQIDYKNSTDYEQIFHLLTHEEVSIYRFYISCFKFK